MKSQAAFCKAQYQLIKDSRAVLFQYCETIIPQDFTSQNSSFGRGSIRNLLVHNINTYQFWIANMALRKNLSFTSYDSCADIFQVVEQYRLADQFMEEFFSVDFESEIAFQIKGKTGSAMPFKLFSHVITHEFHHKGQILSLSRHLGYIPVDTDIMR